MTRHGVALNARPASKCQKEGASVCSLGIHTFLQTFFHLKHLLLHVRKTFLFYEDFYLGHESKHEMKM